MTSYTTSSPHHPQTNGEAERILRALKSLLKKGEDPHKAPHRATPLSSGSSPAQPLMVNGSFSQNVLTYRLSEGRIRTWKRNRSSGLTRDTKQRQEPRPGQKVWVKNTKETGTVSGQLHRHNTLIPREEGHLFFFLSIFILPFLSSEQNNSSNDNTKSK